MEEMFRFEKPFVRDEWDACGAFEEVLEEEWPCCWC